MSDSAPTLRRSSRTTVLASGTPVPTANTKQVPKAATASTGHTKEATPVPPSASLPTQPARSGKAAQLDSSPTPAQQTKVQAPTTKKKTAAVTTTAAKPKRNTPTSVTTQQAPKPAKETKAAITKRTKQEITKTAGKVWELMVEKDGKEMAAREVKSLRHLNDIREDSESEEQADSDAEPAPEPEQSESGEEFDLDVSDSMASEAEVIEDDEAPEIERNAAEGEEVDPAAEEMEALRVRLQYLEGVKAANARAPRQSPTKKTTSFASGLRPAFRTANNPLTSIISVDGGVNTIGGLTEDDLEDERPMPEAHPTSFRTPVGGPAPTNAVVTAVFANDRNLKRNEKRQNLDVAIVAAPQPGTRTTRAPASKSKSSTIQKQPAPPLKAPAPTDSTALPAKSKRLPTKPKKLVPPSKARSKLTANSVRKSDLPDFTQASNKWTENYLPTVFHMYYHASEHFVTWGSNSKTLNETIQGAVDLAYPDEEYQVGMVGDPIQLLTYNRISERRSNLGSDAVIILQEHLGKLKENAGPDCDGLSEVRNWLEWARRDTGPLFFECPTPIHCTADVGEPGFIMPGGRLRSQFVINLVRNALSCSTGSLYTCDATPVGLFALIMAALERAAKWLQPDGTMHQDAQPFSWIHSGFVYQEYHMGLSNDMNLDQWRIVMSAIIDNPESHQPSAVAAPHIHKRASLFSFASPSKRM